MNQISAFEYVSILVSIILGLGITQLLSSFSDLLYNYKKVTFYWPHTIWVIFILFLHVQDWFITYQLKDLPVWYLPQLLFVLLYPIMLFSTAKMILPTIDSEEKQNMKQFYQSQFPMLFLLMAISIFLSIAFNVFLLKRTFAEQTLLLLFMVTMLVNAIKKPASELMHYAISIVLIVATVVSILLEKNTWIIK